MLGYLLLGWRRWHSLGRALEHHMQAQAASGRGDCIVIQVHKCAQYEGNHDLVVSWCERFDTRCGRAHATSEVRRTGRRRACHLSAHLSAWSAIVAQSLQSLHEYTDKSYHVPNSVVETSHVLVQPGNDVEDCASLGVFLRCLTCIQSNRNGWLQAREV